MPLDPEKLRAEPLGPDETKARNPRDLDELQKFVARIKGMLVDPLYLKREQFLRGVLLTVVRTGVVTPKQRSAIEQLEEHPPERTRRW